MRLSELVAAVADRLPVVVIPGGADPKIVDITHDSRQVQAGWLFACLRGERHDGHDYAAAAVGRGAVALLVERELDLPVPRIRAADSRRALPWLADALWHHPSRAMDVVGVTGTNGKTTVTQLLGHVFVAAGRAPAVLGTLSGVRTTPESADLQRWLAARRAEGARTAAIEVSSHGLVLGRVDAVRFAAAVFTNLGHDHLDFHGDMDSYFGAKAELFEAERTAVGVVCRDDPWGARLLTGQAGLDHPTRMVGYGVDDVEDLRIGRAGSSFRWRDHTIELPMVGRFNVLNAVAAATVAVEMGVAVPDIVAGLADSGPVPGRFESVPSSGPAVVVDYAHTPDALATALATAREVLGGSGRVIVVFGCGGDRDREKRPEMGAAAEAGADIVIVTSDNPRGEDPAAIADDVVAGMRGRPSVELDRRRAIRLALTQAGRADLVLIAGKGHETTQTTGDEVVPFDDRQVAAEELAAFDAAP